MTPAKRDMQAFAACVGSLGTALLRSQGGQRAPLIQGFDRFLNAPPNAALVPRLPQAGLNIFKPFTMKWWEAALFKVCTISLGIIVGATWADAFIHLRAVLLVVCILSALYLTRIWWKQ